MKRHLSILLLAVSLASCEDIIDVDSPDFDVQVEKLSWEAGDTVRFRFSGNAGNITFYSGLPGADYNFRDRTVLEGGVPQIDLITQYGGGGTQTESLRLMVSTDLTAMTNEGILAASWTDITDRGSIAPNTTITPSGTIDVSDLADPDKPFFFAFKFVGQTDANRAAGNWIIRGFNATTLTSEGLAIPVAMMQNAGWQPFSIRNNANAWYSRGTPIVDMVIIGGGKNAPESEDWFVTKPLFFTKVPPDTGVPIQNIGTSKLTGYDVVYTQPGTYTVTFLTSNYSVDRHKEKAVQFELTIIE